MSRARGGAWAGPVGVLAAATLTFLVVDSTLSARVAAGADAAQRLAPLYPYLGVDGFYVAARAAGITALLGATASVCLGLAVGGRRAGEVARRGAAVTVHRQVSLVTLILVAVHVALPYGSGFPPYGGWRTALLPFAQPYSWGATATWAESAGIVAGYLMLLLGPSYYLAGRWRHGWASAHRLVVATYVLAVLHTLVLGSDFLIQGPARVGLIGLQVPVLVLVTRRLWPRGPQEPRDPQEAGGPEAGDPNRTPSRRRPTARRLGRRLAFVGAGLLTVTALALTLDGVWGAHLGGFPLPSGP